MFRPLAHSVRRPAPRRGALLIAVLGLLTLFAIFALFFVFYADNEARGARIARDAEAEGEVGPPDDFARETFNQLLRSAIFDTPDTDIGNPFRGVGLNRTMYNGQIGQSAPFSGIGTFHEQWPQITDRALWINPTAPLTITNGPAGPPLTTYYLDPEFTGFRTSVEVAAGTLPSATGRNPAFVPKNAPYTYPDLKDLILASMSPSTGEVMAKSMHRDWLFNAGNPNVTLRLAPWNPADVAPATNTAANTDWVYPEGRTRILRPRPIDQLTQGDITGAGLPYPLLPGLSNYSAANRTTLYNLILSRITAGFIIPYPPFNADGSYSGDVQNLMGGVGVQKNDSILLDLGLQPRKWNGKWIKPMVSILLTDLDGLLNLNAHGNIRGTGTPGSHGSYAGFGPHEVNLGAVLGNGDAANLVRARYNFQPWSPNTLYPPNSLVMNYGNFYRSVNPGPAMSAASPGPSGNYPSPQSTPNDGAVIWENINIQLPANGNFALQMEGGRTPLYSQTNFDAGGNGATITYPVTQPNPMMPNNAFQTNVLYTNTGSQSFFDDNISDSATYNKYINHPLLFNPNDRPSGNANRRTYPLSDTKRFSMRYGSDIDWFRQTDIARYATPFQPLAPSLVYTGFPNAPTFGGGSYRLDPSHANRGLLTTLGTSLDLPGMVGNFNFSAVPGFPQLFNNQVAAGQLHPVNPAFTAPYSPGASPDFNTATDWRNPRAGLGPVDLNRPLADYRDLNSPPNITVVMGNPTQTPQPLTGANMANAAQAWADRHNLARDIFGRLIVATGANAQIAANGDITIPPFAGMGAIPPEQINALRYLAQLAVNMVDAIDNDDINTTFVWNPADAMGNNAALTNVDATTVLQFLPTNFTNQAAVQAHCVFGVEKPRLVLNEAMGELTNGMENFAGVPAQPGLVRFYVELLNPTASPYNPAGLTSSPLGNGAATLYDAGNARSIYQMVVTMEDGTIMPALRNPANVEGVVTPVANRSLLFDFSRSVANGLNTVAPVNGAYVPNNGNPGFVLVGASQFTNPHMSQNGMSVVEFDPSGNAPYATRMIQGNPVGGGGPNTSMEYTYGAVPATTDLETDNAMNPLRSLRRHVILLRRLANPYLAPNPAVAGGPVNPAMPYNPYITVDVMDWVPAFDAVARGSMDAANNRNPKTAVGVANAGFDPLEDTSGGQRRYSVGKVQPYAGFANGSDPGVGNGLPVINSFPSSFVVAQAPAATNTSYATAVAAGYPLNTFFRQNGRRDTAATYTAQTYNVAPLIMPGGETLMAPFLPYVHYDRPLVNTMELLSLQATKSHEVTQFAVQNVAGALRTDLGLAPWTGMTPNPVAMANPPYLPGIQNTGSHIATNNGLYRALDFLRVKPWIYGQASGGKVQGRININTIQDSRILAAILDPRNGNFFTNAEVSNVWTGMINTNAPVAGTPYRTQQSSSRTIANGSVVVVPQPGPTCDDMPTTGNFDRPFKSFGGAEFSPNAMGFAARHGTGIQDTLLRTNPVGTNPNIPMIWSTNANVIPSLDATGNGLPNQQLQSEMLRKMMNNTTTVSHAFALSATIVFHEVRMNGVNMEVVNEAVAPAAGTYYGYGQVSQPTAGVRYLIGKEAYKEIPGDLRQQFFAIIDRSNLVLDATGTVFQPVDPVTGQIRNPLVPPMSAALDQPIVIGSTAPVPPGGMGWQNPPSGSYNVYLANRSPSGGSLQPFTLAGNFGLQVAVMADGRQVVLSQGSVINIGVGTDRETFIVNYVNQDGSLNIGDPNAPNGQLGLGFRNAPAHAHGEGSLLSNYVTGNPGPFPLPAGVPFDPLNQATNNPLRGVVPYAQRVR